MYHKSFNIFLKLSQVLWQKSVIPVYGRLRQKELEFKANLSYIARLCLKRKTKIKLGTCGSHLQS